MIEHNFCFILGVCERIVGRGEERGRGYLAVKGHVREGERGKVGGSGRRQGGKKLNLLAYRAILSPTLTREEMFSIEIKSTSRIP